MRILRHWTFGVMAIVAGVIYGCQRLGVSLPMFINNYLNDILSIPLCLYVVLAIVRQWRQTDFILSKGHIMGVVVYFSFYFEYYLPQHHPRYTSDFWDVLCYVGGGVLFYFIQKVYLVEK